MKQVRPAASHNRRQNFPDQRVGDERGKQVDMRRLWIDIGAADGKEARKLVKVGDPITFKLGVTDLGKNIIASPACDDKAGLFVCMEALRLVSEKIGKEVWFWINRPYLEGVLGNVLGYVQDSA